MRGPTWRPADSTGWRTASWFRFAGREQTKQAREGQLRESIAAIYPATGGDVPADGGDVSGGRRCVLPASRVGSARGGLSDDPGADILSGGESGCGGVGGNGSSRKAIRTGCGTEPDDIDERGRSFGDRDAIPAQSQYRCGGARGAGGDQRGTELSAGQSADAADLQQVESS